MTLAPYRRFVRRRLQQMVASLMLPAMLAVPTVPAAMTSGGCSFFVPAKQEITLNSSNPSAALFVNGEQVGTGRAVVSLARNKSHSVQARLPDGRVAGRYLSRSISTTGILDIVGGVLFIIPVAGLLAPGAWQLSPDFVQLDIAPAPAPSSYAPFTPPAPASTNPAAAPR